MPTEIAADTFAYADSVDLMAVAPNWSLVESFVGALPGVVSGKVYPVGANRACVRWNADSFPNDQYVEATIDQLGDSEAMGISIRCAPSAVSYYMFIVEFTVGGGYMTIMKMVDGVPYDVIGQGLSLVTPCTLRLEARGTSLVGLINGESKLAFTDSSLASGYPGIAFRGNNVSPTSLLDNWSGGALGTAPLEAPHSDVERAIGYPGRPSRRFRR